MTARRLASIPVRRRMVLPPPPSVRASSAFFTRFKRICLTPKGSTQALGRKGSKESSTAMPRCANSPEVKRRTSEIASFKSTCSKRQELADHPPRHPRIGSVAAAHRREAVDLVEEEDAGRGLARLFEHLANPLFALADVFREEGRAASPRSRRRTCGSPRGRRPR